MARVVGLWYRTLAGVRVVEFVVHLCNKVGIGLVCVTGMYQILCSKGDCGVICGTDL